MKDIKKVKEALKEDESLIKGFLNNIFKSKYQQVKELSEDLILALEDLESVPLRFHSPQTVDIETYLEVIQILEEKVPQNQIELKRGKIALGYRLETIKKDVANQGVINLLIEHAIDWKGKQPLIADKWLSKKEIQYIKETTEYSEFAKLIIVDEALRHQFFTWIIRDQIAPAPFIEFPGFVKKIIDSNLNGRIGRIDGRSLKIKKEVHDGIVEKHLVLPFEGNDISILNPNKEITFRGNFRLTVKEIFNIFKNKEFCFEKLEFMKDGIINWNTRRWGYWNAEINDYTMLDLNQAGWWKQLPAFEVIDIDEAQERYGKNLDGTQWNIAVTSTRGTTLLDFQGTHAYEEIAIPMGDGKYAIYAFGKYGIKFPKNFVEAVLTISHTIKATIAYPDENVFYSHRQHTNHNIAITPEQGIELLDIVRSEMIKCREGNMVYQIESENCAKWTQVKLEELLGKENVPNLFITPLLKATPEGVAGTFFDIVKFFPRFLRVYIFNSVHVPFGSGKGEWIIEDGKRVWKSLDTHEFWVHGITYLPCFLHHQQVEGTLCSGLYLKEKFIKPVKKLVLDTVNFVSRSLKVKFLHLFENLISCISYEQDSFNTDLHRSDPGPQALSTTQREMESSRQVRFQRQCHQML